MINELLKGLSKMTTTSEEALPDVLILHFTIVTACMVGQGDCSVSNILWALLVL